MILRKPYAFFIKYFRLIHALLFVFLCYNLYRITKISSFLSLVVKDNTSVLGTNIVEKYVGNILYILPILIILLLIIILWTLIVKKKDTKEYKISLLCLVVSYILLFIIFNTLNDLETTILEIRTIRLVRDFALLSNLLHIYPIILSLIRFTGFDIKKFDFEKDLIDLNITEEDREEFEVDFNFDTNLFKRKINYQKRQFKYFLKEYKKYILTSILFIVIISGLVIYNNFYKFNKYINYNEEIFINNSSYKIVSSYVTDTDYKGNIIDKNFNFVIVKMLAKKNVTKSTKINTAYLELHINNHVFNAIDSTGKYFIDLGTKYSNKDLTDEYKEYIFIYKIPKLYSNDEMQFKIIRYLNTYKKKDVTNYYILNLNNVNFYDHNDYGITNLNNVLNFNDYLLKNTSLKIYNYEIKDKFKIDYTFNANGTIIPSVSYVKSRYIGSYDKTVLKLNYEYISNGIYNTLFDLIGSTATLTYNVDGNNIINSFVKLNSKVNDNNLYLEVPASIKDAKSIKLNFNVRGNTYTYVLMEG